VAPYTREVKLDHGWRKSTVGGVVQQYLAEVERTITDPTLTSTYEKLSRRLLNTVKNKIYYTL
jgi:predicted transcriptional regulator